MSTDYKISNYKLSIKIAKLDWNATLILLKKCQQLFKIHNNFLVFKVGQPNTFTYTLFKPKLPTAAHLNITNIKCKSVFGHALETIQKFVCGKLILDTLRIDNITASTSLAHPINLENFLSKNSKSYSIKYNKDKFPGAFIKTSIGTILLFYTGKIILVGCKKEEQIKELIGTIHNLTANHVSDPLH